jgi:hypothetical protein
MRRQQHAKFGFQKGFAGGVKTTVAAVIILVKNRMLIEGQQLVWACHGTHCGWWISVLSNARYLNTTKAVAVFQLCEMCADSG